MPDTPNIIVIDSDLHAGSTVSPCLPDFPVGEDGNRIKLNDCQQWILDCWEKANAATRVIVGDDPYAYVNMGDVVEGCHHTLEQIIDNNVGTHRALATELLRPIAEEAQVSYFVAGTRTHVGYDENDVAKACKAVRCRPGVYTWPRLHLEQNGVLIDFAHHIPPSLNPETKGNKALKALFQSQHAAATTGHKPPRIVVRGHAHSYVQVEVPEGVSIVCPSWKAVDLYAQSKNPALTSCVGRIILDARGVEKGRLPRIHRLLYPVYDPFTANRK